MESGGDSRFGLSDCPREGALIDRRTFLAGSGAVIVALPVAAGAQKKLPHVAILGLGPTPSAQELARSVSTNPFLQSIRLLACADAQHMLVDRRFVESPAQLRRLAA